MNLSDSGYLFDPDSEFGNIYNPDVFPFEKIAKFHCLGLLGEPGIGKSTGMLAQKGIIDARVNEAGKPHNGLTLGLFRLTLGLSRQFLKIPFFSIGRTAVIAYIFFSTA